MYYGIYLMMNVLLLRFNVNMIHLRNEMNDWMNEWMNDSAVIWSVFENQL